MIPLLFNLTAVALWVVGAPALTFWYIIHKREARRPAPLAPWQEADHWDGVQPFTGIPFTVNPNVPEGQVFLINMDNLKFEPVIFEDPVNGKMLGIDSVSEWWEIAQEKRNPDARMIITGMHKEGTDGEG